MSKRNRTGKMVLSIGFISFICGLMFNKRFGLEDTPEFLETLSLPLIVVGVIMLILSNFLKKIAKMKYSTLIRGQYTGNLERFVGIVKPVTVLMLLSTKNTIDLFL